MLRRSLALGQIGLVVGCLAVPLVAVGAAADRDDPATRYRLLCGLGLYPSDGGHSFDSHAHPNGVPVVLALTKAGLVLPFGAAAWLLSLCRARASVES